MTFDEFRRARVKVADVSVGGRWTDTAPEGDPVLSRAGWIYPTGLFIEDVGHDWPKDAQLEGAHHLAISNMEWISDDLSHLERILYNAYRSEIVDDLAAGNAAAMEVARTMGQEANVRIVAAGLI